MTTMKRSITYESKYGENVFQYFRCHFQLNDPYMNVVMPLLSSSSSFLVSSLSFYNFSSSFLKNTDTDDKERRRRGVLVVLLRGGI